MRFGKTVFRNLVYFLETTGLSRKPMDFRLGIDLGGTKIEGAVLDTAGRIVFRRRIPTGQENGYRGILESIRGLYGEMACAIRGAPHTLGIGTPGAISRKTGFLKNSNTQCLNGNFCREDVEGLLGRKVAIENDANCFALAEASGGAGRGKEMVFGVILGTGCGGGMIYRGRLIPGLQAIAGEWGHMVIDFSGPACYCGSRGCVETFVSGGGAAAMYGALYGERLTLPEIVEKSRQGEVRSCEFMSNFFSYFGRALANLINILDPDIVVLGGGVSEMEELYTKGVREVKRRVFSDEMETPIVKNCLGDSAGVIGAALLGV